jgi:hypothetical protein
MTNIIFFLKYIKKLSKCAHVFSFASSASFKMGEELEHVCFCPVLLQKPRDCAHVLGSAFSKSLYIYHGPAIHFLYFSSPSKQNISRTMAVSACCTCSEILRSVAPCSEIVLIQIILMLNTQSLAQM